MGDNRTGEGDGDDEVIKIKLDKIPSDYETLAMTVTIYDAESRLQNFGMVGNAYVRVVDEETGEELIRFDLSEDFSTETALVVAEIYKHSNYCSYCSSWVQRAIIYNGEQVEKWIDNCREFEKALDRSEVFRSVL